MTVATPNKLRRELTAAYVTMARGSYEDSNAAYGDVIQIESALEDEGRLDLIDLAYQRAERHCDAVAGLAAAVNH